MLAAHELWDGQEVSNIRSLTWQPLRPLLHLCLALWRLKNAGQIGSLNIAKAYGPVVAFDDLGSLEPEDVCEHLLRDSQTFFQFLTIAKGLETEVSNGPGLLSDEAPLHRFRLSV